jgi:hypothetical protein
MALVSTWGREAAGPPRCRHCGDVIGIYEPVILRLPGGDHRTSRLAEPDLFGDERDWYHELCFGLADAAEDDA